MAEINPFLVYGYKSPEYFCDRTEETEKIIEALRNGRNLVLMSPRRMGKTGLIKHAFYTLKESEPEIYTFYFDILGTSSLRDFVQVFAKAVLGKFDSSPQKALRRVKDFISSCRPIFSYDPITGSPEITIDAVPTNAEPTLKEIFDYIAASGKKCYIAIDEFQQVAEYEDKNVEAKLRSYIQFIPNVNFIFAGSKMHLLSEMFISAKRPFYQSAQPLALLAIDEKAYYSFAAEKFKKVHTDLSFEDFDYIYKRYEGHTWYIQDILNRLYTYNEPITKDLIDKAIGNIVDEFSFTYEQMIGRYSPSYINVMKRLASEHTVKEITSAKFLQGSGVKASSSMQRIIKNLIEDELVYKDTKGYSIYDRFFEEWLNRSK